VQVTIGAAAAGIRADPLSSAAGAEVARLAALGLTPVVLLVGESGSVMVS
jgi:hypothetical protein